MTREEAIAVVRGKYPRSIAIPNPVTRMNELVLDSLKPDSNRYGSSGSITETWIRFATYIKNGADF